MHRVLAVLALLCLVPCISALTVHELTAATDICTRWENEFAFNFYRNLSVVLKKAKAPSLVFAPYALYASLAGVYEAAGKQSKNQLRSALRINPYALALSEGDGEAIRRNATTYHTHRILKQRGDSRSVDVANIILVARSLGINSDTAHLLKSSYRVAVKNSHFQFHSSEIREKVNAWVSEHTGHRIAEIISEKSQKVIGATSTVLVQGLAVCRPWATQFSSSETVTMSFWVYFTEVIEVPTMKIFGTTLSYFKDSFAHVIDLPLRSALRSTEIDLSMIIIQPANFDLYQVHRRLDEGALSNWLKRMKPRTMDMLSLPKFNVYSDAADLKTFWASDFAFEKTLSEMNVRDIFHAKDADLSGLVDGKSSANAHVDHVFHFTGITVDEHGVCTRSGGSVEGRSHSNKEFDVGVKYAQHNLSEEFVHMAVTSPFVFLLRDTASGKILVMGHVFNPIES